MASTEKEIRAAYKRLAKAAKEFKKELDSFKTIYDPNSVGISEWKEDIDDAMFEIEADIDGQFGAEEE